MAMSLDKLWVCVIEIGGSVEPSITEAQLAYSTKHRCNVLPSCGAGQEYLGRGILIFIAAFSAVKTLPALRCTEKVQNAEGFLISALALR